MTGFTNAKAWVDGELNASLSSQGDADSGLSHRRGTVSVVVGERLDHDETNDEANGDADDCHQWYRQLKALVRRQMRN